MIDLQRPPLDEKRKAWADWFFKVYQRLTFAQLPIETDVSRGTAGNKGRIIFNSDDGLINVDDGTQWTDAMGNPT